jgi:hypothetical protein
MSLKEEQGKTRNAAQDTRRDTEARACRARATEEVVRSLHFMLKKLGSC